jgi:hypothetical protein
MKILGGVIGAVIGYLAGITVFSLLDMGNRNDPIMSGFLALLVAGPIGLLAGVIGGTRLGIAIARGRAKDSAAVAGNAGAGLAKNSLISLGIVLACVAVAGGGYYAYAVATATPWLRPGGVVLQFEVRYPAGTVLPAAKTITFELVTDINTMPGEVHAARFRNDGDKPVIAGEVDLAFRTRNRELEVKMPGRMDRTYQIRIPDTAPHASALGRWEPHPDGSEFRYRAKWPGRD